MAEDVLQNVFEKALLYSEKILELPDEKAFTFLYVIVRNTAYDMIKVESRNNHEELTYEDGEDSEYLIDPNDYYMEYIDLNVMVDKIAGCQRTSRQFLSCTIIMDSAFWK